MDPQLDPWFHQFFGEEFGRRFEIPRDRREKSRGSGVIVSPGGYILTNNHVASAANELTVKLSDGRELRARRIGVDRTMFYALYSWQVFVKTPRGDRRVTGPGLR